MYAKSQSSVVHHTLLSLYHKNQQEKLREGHPLVLVLLSYHMIGMEEGLTSLKALKEENNRIQIWSDDQLETYCGRKKIIHQTGIDDWLSSDNCPEDSRSNRFCP